MLAIQIGGVYWQICWNVFGGNVCNLIAKNTAQIVLFAIVRNQAGKGQLPCLPSVFPNIRWELLARISSPTYPKVQNCNTLLFWFWHVVKKMTHFVPCHKEVTAEETTHLFIDNFYRLHGVPKVIVSDIEIPALLVNFGNLSRGNWKPSSIRPRPNNLKLMALPNGLMKQCKYCCVGIQPSLSLLGFLINLWLNFIKIVLSMKLLNILRLKCPMDFTQPIMPIDYFH